GLGEGAAYVVGLGIPVPLSFGGSTFENAQGPCNVSVIPRVQGSELIGRSYHRTQAREHVVDHSVETHPAAVLGRIDLLHPVPLQRLDSVRRNGPATADDNPDIRPATLLEHVHHVLEILIVAALIGAHGDTTRILLDGSADNIRYAAVVPQVDYLGA